jgi:hypothetical protein
MIEKKIVIIVEGKADAIFIRDYLQHLYQKQNKDFIPITAASNNQKKKEKDNLEKGYLLVFQKPDIRIFSTDGCAKLYSEHKTTLKGFADAETTMLVIFDTDNPSKTFGGFEKRKTYLEVEQEKISKENIENGGKPVNFADIFLLPTNPINKDFNKAENGDLETLLHKIVIPEKYKQFFDCYDAFCQCISSFSAFSKDYQTEKFFIYNYIKTHQGDEFANEGSRNYRLADFWNLEHEGLQPLKNFFERNIK